MSRPSGCLTASEGRGAGPSRDWAGPSRKRGGSAPSAQAPLPREYLDHIEGARAALRGPGAGVVASGSKIMLTRAGATSATSRAGSAGLRGMVRAASPGRRSFQGRGEVKIAGQRHGHGQPRQSAGQRGVRQAASARHAGTDHFTDPIDGPPRAGVVAVGSGGKLCAPPGQDQRAPCRIAPSARPCGSPPASGASGHRARQGIGSKRTVRATRHTAPSCDTSITADPAQACGNS